MFTFYENYVYDMTKCGVETKVTVMPVHLFDLNSCSIDLTNLSNSSHIWLYHFSI